MDIRCITTKMNYGEGAIYGVAKLFASPQDKEGEVNKTLIAGVILTEESLTPNQNEEGFDIERMYECEIIIIPKHIYEKNIYTGGGARIDQVLVSGYEDPNNYEKQIK